MSTVVSDRHLPVIQPLTARSVVLSTLLGYHPPALPVRALIRVGALFDVSEQAIRVALTRMTADGDVVADYGAYRLTDRLLRRQALQEESRAPRTVPWDGMWEMVVLGGGARPIAERTARRKHMIGLRLAELREGVWMRPANLARPLDGVDVEAATVFAARHETPDRVVEALWDLPSWAAEARLLHRKFDAAASLVDGFMLIAEVLRHLQVDPCLPAELLPPDWPGVDLRARHTEFTAAFAERLRRYSSE